MCGVGGADDGLVLSTVMGFTCSMACNWMVSSIRLPPHDHDNGGDDDNNNVITFSCFL